MKLSSLPFLFKLSVAYFFFLLSLFSFFASGILDSHDGLLYLSVARNIYYKGDITAPIYEYDAKNNTGKNIHLGTYIGMNGKTYSHTGLGYSLALLPSVALTDIAYKYFHINPPQHFPLENDWLILLTASFTNIFFGALLGTVLLLYFIELGLKIKQAIFMSLVSIFATNLWVYTKHSFAHMMFIAFLVLAIFLLKKYSRSRQHLLLISSGVSYGIMAITYNQTFVLTIIPFLLYYLLLTKAKINFLYVKKALRDLLLFGIGFLPFLLIYVWDSQMRAPVPNAVTDGFGAGVIRYYGALVHVPLSLFIEGIYGQLLSPGRSIFIYSPLLLIIVFFWHRAKSNIKPEFITFLAFAIIYIIFYASAFVMSNSALDPQGLWHGESSWGPRYLTPLIPFGMLIVGSIFLSLSRLEKRLLFYPLIIIGIYIEVLGIILPYQIKFHNLEKKFYINNTEYTVGFYSDLLPRYTPILSMSKNLIKLALNFPKTFDHGIYNVKFYDGIEFPFDVGPERWREVAGKGYISFDNNQKNPVKDLTFGLINHPISESSESAKIQFVLNNVPLLKEPFNLDLRQREQVKVPVGEGVVKPQDNRLMIEVNYGKNDVISAHKQILGFQSFDINGTRQNMESLDIPYVSPLGPKMTGVNYQNWGGTNKDPWKLWELHTQIFERVPDFWWLRNLYHWDIPKNLILMLFALNSAGLLFFGLKVFSIIRKIPK